MGRAASPPPPSPSVLYDSRVKSGKTLNRRREEGSRRETKTERVHRVNAANGGAGARRERGQGPRVYARCTVR